MHGAASDHQCDGPGNMLRSNALPGPRSLLSRSCRRPEGGEPAVTEGLDLGTN